MKNILVTGCAGLIGVNFVNYLLNKKYKVIGVDNLFGGYEDFLPDNDNFIFYNIDLIETNKVKKIFEQNEIDVVYHFAAYAAEGLSPFIRKFNYENNTITSINLINECIERDIKLIFTSSMAVYGGQEPPFNENQKPSPVDPYGIAKYTVEQDIISANEQFGLKYNIVRPHNVLGLYQNIWDKYRNVIGIFIRKVLDGEPITIYGDGEQKRAFSDIKFYLEPLEKMIYGFDNEIFNIGADKFFTIKEVANIVENVGKKYGYNPQKVYLENRHEVKDAYCNHDKAKTFLDFEDNTDIEQLIDDMFKWAMSQPKREVKNIPYEVTKDIYSFWK